MSSKGKELRVSLSDLQCICKRSKKSIYFGIALFAFLGMFQALTRPVQYTAEATFRERAKSQIGLNSNALTSLLLSGGSDRNNSEAISTMTSHTIVKNLVQRLNLQGTFLKDPPPSLFGHIADNLWTEYGLYYGKQGLFFKDNPLPIALKDLSYPGEYAVIYRITILPDDSYEIMRSRTDTPVQVKFGEPFSQHGVTFTLVRKHPGEIAYKKFKLLVEPMKNVVDRLSDAIYVENSRQDKSLLSLEYIHTNRHHAVEILNTLMAVYQEYLQEEQQRISAKQLAYLNMRYDEMKQRLQKMMEEHASVLSSDVISMGFPDANSAITFFANAQQQYIRELMTIDLELKRLQQMQQEDAIYDRPTHENAGSPIGNYMTQIRQLKRQADSIELSLRDHQEPEEDLSKHLNRLNDIKQLTQEATSLVAIVEKGDSVEKVEKELPKLHEDGRYKIHAWCQRLGSSNNGCKEQFLAYLANLIHLFNVEQEAIQEKLVHHRTSSPEFEGIDLATGKEIYLNYSRELNRIESEKSQKQFIIEQMKSPDFEMSSLCTVLLDPVSQKMIGQASPFLLALKDQHNRTAKEQERLRSEVDTEKAFLSAHLNQTVQLLQLQEKLLQDKIQNLQSATLTLIRQESSVLQNHMRDYIQSRIDNLLQERSLIEKHQQEMQLEMAKLPNKWVGERLIHQQMEINAGMVEELTRLVESKNTTSNLEIIQSAPIDQAVAPIKPNPPRTLFFTLFGAILGGLLSVSFFFVKALVKGLPVTADNLQLAEQNVAGTLSKQPYSSNLPLLDKDLETLRHLIARMTEGRSALLLTSSFRDYSPQLASLLHKKGQKVLLLPLSFTHVETDSNQFPGLLQYLEGDAETPKIHHAQEFDFISAGGISRHANEMLNTPRFHALLQQLIDQYDWVIGITSAPVQSAEASTLYPFFKQLIVTVTHQTWKELSAAEDSMADHNNLTFIIAEE